MRKVVFQFVPDGHVQVPPVQFVPAGSQFVAFEHVNPTPAADRQVLVFTG